MFSFPNSKSLPDDVVQFQSNLKRWFGGIFVPQRDIIVARAPARLDVMGGVIDYSGGIVLETPLKEAVIVGVQKRRDQRLLVRSLGIEKQNFNSTCELLLDDFYTNGQIKSYSSVQRMFSENPKTGWAGYVLGAFFVLLKEGLINDFPSGATIGISSSIPIGAGVSSSAALEVATMFAVQESFGLSFDGLDLARLCQMAENRIVGAPCGIMDQVTSALGEKNRLLVLKCQPHDIVKMVGVPKGFRFIGINSAVRHSVGGSKYIDARIGTFKGRKIILEKLLEDDPDNWPYDGFICNITPDEYHTLFGQSIPARMKGTDFLDQYKSLDDPVTNIDAARTYRVRSRVEHAVHENHRVLRFIEILEKGEPWASEQEIIEAGEFMYASHWSYSRRLGLGCRETDLLVDLVRKAGPDRGLYGAKISGGGSGGTVAVLAATGTDDIIKNIAAQYHYQTGLKPDLFPSSSAGALEFGTLKMQLE